MQNLRRSAKNFAYNYSDAQKAVREATSNSPSGPTSTQMIMIADMMRDHISFDEVMSVLWKRLNDSGKNWRHVFKSLCVLDFLIKAGNDRVAILCRSNLYAIETLRDFQHVEEGRDQGIHIRDKAKQLVTLLANGGKITNKDGTTSDGIIRQQPCGEQVRRPATATEEDEQLRIALELSLQEQKKENNLEDEYEIRLRQALEESRKEAESVKTILAQSPAKFELPNGKQKSNVDDLLSLGDLDLNQQPQPSSSLNWYNTGLNDPWAPQQSVTPIPQTVLPSQIIGIDVDPWAPQQPSVTYAPFSTYDAMPLPPSESHYGRNNMAHSYADPFSANPYDTLVDYEKQNNSNLAQSSRFLGVHNPNIDVDSLIQIDNMNRSNPFLQAGMEPKRTPTLNELRAQQQAYPTPPISPFPSSIPSSQMPPISSTNPFASAF